MAVGSPINRGLAGGTTSAVTVSFTPTAGSILLALCTTKAASAPGVPTISDSIGGTWDLITNAVTGPASNPFIKGALYRHIVPASPAARTVTAAGGTTSTVISVIEVTGASYDLSNLAINANTAGDPSCTLPTAPEAASAVFGWCVGHLTAAVTQVGTYTELFDSNPAGGTNHRIEFAYDLSSPAQTLSWTSTLTNSVGIAVEIKEGGRPKVYSGSAWVRKPMKVWSGSAWVTKPVKVYKNGAWALV
jgi:hypothetical protein